MRNKTINRCTECGTRPDVHKLNGWFYIRCGGLFCKKNYVQSRTEEGAKALWNFQHPKQNSNGGQKNVSSSNIA